MSGGAVTTSTRSPSRNPAHAGSQVPSTSRASKVLEERDELLLALGLALVLPCLLVGALADEKASARRRPVTSLERVRQERRVLRAPRRASGGRTRPAGTRPRAARPPAPPARLARAPSRRDRALWTAGGLPASRAAGAARARAEALASARRGRARRLPGSCLGLVSGVRLRRRTSAASGRAGRSRACGPPAAPAGRRATRGRGRLRAVSPSRARARAAGAGRRPGARRRPRGRGDPRAVARRARRAGSPASGAAPASPP